jgi:hypothetical protein
MGDSLIKREKRALNEMGSEHLNDTSSKMQMSYFFISFDLSDHNAENKLRIISTTDF